MKYAGTRRRETPAGESFGEERGLRGLLTAELVGLVACGGSGELVEGVLAAEVLRAGLQGVEPLAGKCQR